MDMHSKEFNMTGPVQMPVFLIGIIPEYLSTASCGEVNHNGHGISLSGAISGVSLLTKDIRPKSERRLNE
jgi:hypothetical protein